MQQRIGKDGQLFNSFLGAVLLVLLPVAVFVYEQVSGHYLSDYGLLPRNLSGLRGILFMPFLHGFVCLLSRLFRRTATRPTKAINTVAVSTTEQLSDRYIQ